MQTFWKLKTACSALRDFKTKLAKGKTKPDIFTKLNITPTLVFPRKLPVPFLEVPNQRYKI